MAITELTIVELNFGVVIAFVLYFAVIFLVGLYFYKRTHSMKDYTLGNREMNPYVTALSAQAADMSGWMLMGLPGAIYMFGIGQIWIGIGLAIGSYCAWLFIAKRLRKYSERSNSLTISEFFSNRYKDRNQYLKLISAVVILVFFLFYVTSGLVAGGKLLVIIFGDNIDYSVAVWITALIIISYTFLGGFKAVCWNDFFQAILMIVAVVVVPLAAFGMIDGGFEAAVEIANHEVSNFFDLFSYNGSPITAVILISCLAWGLGYFGMPHLAVKYMAIKNPEDVKVARRVGTIWLIIAIVSIAMIALAGRAYFSPEGIDDPENVFINLVGSIFTGGVGISIIAGVLYAALMAAIMSSADSQLLVASSTVTNDLYSRFKKKDEKKDSKELMKVSRIAVIVIAVIAAVLAMDKNSSIMQLVAFAWAGFGAAFGSVMLLSLYWKRGNSKGALAGMIVGFATVVLWNTFMVTGGVIPTLFNVNCCIIDTGLYELLPGFILAVIAMVAVSLLTEPPTPEMEQEFEDATAGKFL